MGVRSSSLPSSHSAAHGTASADRYPIRKARAGGALPEGGGALGWAPRPPAASREREGVRRAARAGAEGLVGVDGAGDTGVESAADERPAAAAPGVGRWSRSAPAAPTRRATAAA